MPRRTAATILVHGVPGDTVREWSARNALTARKAMYGMTSDSPAAELTDSPRAEVHWPVRVGAMPARANEFSPRPESAPGLGTALVPGATVALVSGRAGGPASLPSRTG